MKPNLDVVDRVLRFALAFWLLGPVAPHFGADWVNVVIAFIGWVALVESFIGWCGLYVIFGINNKDQ